MKEVCDNPFLAAMYRTLHKNVDDIVNSSNEELLTDATDQFAINISVLLNYKRNAWRGN